MSHPAIPESFEHPDRMFRALACDGPLNGQYITVREAIENDYHLQHWPSLEGQPAEQVYMQAGIWADQVTEAELHPEDAALITDIIMEAPLA